MIGIWQKFRKKKPERHAWQAFYQRFEDRFRGSQKDIEERFAQRYSRHLKEIKDQHGAIKALDLGCGRGEFLNILKSFGSTGTGVDSNREAIKRCHQMGHKVVESDILRYMKKTPSSSLNLITAFHVIEHCDPPYFFKIFTEAHRILENDGALLIETPSLYSLWASARQFYLDPTHIRPVHPQYMEFMAADCGFSEVSTLEFEEVADPRRAHILRALPEAEDANLQNLDRWLYGSMDIALWAKK